MCYARFRILFLKIIVNGGAMETIVLIYSTYGKLFCLWWWVPLAIIIFLVRFVYLLKEDDATLSMRRAIEFVFIGLFSLLPYARKYISLLNRIDFNMRWKAVGVCDFRVSALVSFLYCLLFAPIALLLTCRLILMIINRRADSVGDGKEEDWEEL